MSQLRGGRRTTLYSTIPGAALLSPLRGHDPALSHALGSGRGSLVQVAFQLPCNLLEVKTTVRDAGLADEGGQNAHATQQHVFDSHGVATLSL